MLTRQIGKILRGKATPLQVMMAAILGSMLGFVPGFAEGPGLIIALTLLLIILNANLGVAAIVGLLAKLASLALVPVTFQVGRVLLDGPTQPLFKMLINAPGTALFGLEHYLTAGGVVVGLVFGAVAGLMFISLLGAFRRKMARLEEGSQLFQQWTSKGWVKFMMFLFVGGSKGKLSYADLVQKRAGNPIRILGVVFAVLVIALLWIGQAYLSGPILTMALRDGLEKANGATVDLGNAEVDLKAGKVQISGLAMADASALETDLLRASTIEADLSSTDLLRKRAKFDRVVINDATSGMKRAVPGVLIGPPPQPAPAPAPQGDEKTVDDYIADAKLWKERLAQAREWLEKLSGPEDAAEDGTGRTRQETLEERIARQIRESGYASVTASHLVEGAPTLTITELLAEGVKAAMLEGEVLDVRGENLSTHPSLLAAGPRISVKSRSKKITFIARLGELAAAAPAAAAGSSSDDTPGNENAERGSNRVRFTYLGLPIDSVAKHLSVPGGPPVAGGTVDIDIRGGWSVAGVGNLDLPLNLTLHDTTISIPQAGSQKVSEMKLALGLRGPMDNPRITLDDQALADALKAAGADILASKVQAEADKAINQGKKKAASEIEKKLDEELGGKAKSGLGDDAKKAIEGLLPR